MMQCKIHYLAMLTAIAAFNPLLAQPSAKNELEVGIGLAAGPDHPGSDEYRPLPLLCPACGTLIPPDRMNVADGIAACPQCG